MIDTGGTILKAVDELKKFGARKIFIFVTHGLFNGNFYEKIQKNNNFNFLYCTDSLPIKNEQKEKNSRIKRISLQPLISSFIKKYWTLDV